MAGTLSLPTDAALSSASKADLVVALEEAQANEALPLAIEVPLRSRRRIPRRRTRGRARSCAVQSLQRPERRHERGWQTAAVCSCWWREGPGPRADKATPAGGMLAVGGTTATAAEDEPATVESAPRVDRLTTFRTEAVGCPTLARRTRRDEIMLVVACLDAGARGTVCPTRRSRGRRGGAQNYQIDLFGYPPFWPLGGASRNT